MQRGTGIDQYHVVLGKRLRVGHTVRVGGGLAEQHDLEGGASVHAAGDVGVIKKRLYFAGVDAQV